LGKASIEPELPIVIGSGNKPIVFESLNGQLWREVHYERNPLLLGGRPAAYNKLHEEEILSRCFNPKATLLESRYKDLIFPGMSTDLIKGKVTEDMTSHFDGLLGEKITLHELRRMKIDKRLLTQSMLKHVMSQYDIPRERDLEYVTTFVAQFEAAYRRVNESFDKGWASMSIPSRWFKDYSGDELREKVLAEFKMILNTALGEMDKNTEWAEVDESYKLFARANSDN
jgi:hypothetical protein